MMDTLFTTDDGLLTITDSRNDDGAIRISMAAGRCLYCVKPESIVILDNSLDEMWLMIFQDTGYSDLYLKDATEAERIAKFLKLSVSVYDSTGNAFVQLEESKR